MYTQLNYLAAQQRSAELRAIGERSRVMADSQPASRASSHPRRTGQWTTRFRGLTARLAHSRA
jgi:hypothetical protein